MYTMSSPFPQVLVVSLVDYPLYLMGLFIVKAAISKSKDPDIIDSWKDIIFTKNEIMVKNLDLSLKKISVEDIITIKLQTTNITPKKSTTSYLIALKLTCLKKKEYDFGEIYKSTDKLRRDHIYNCLAYQIRNFYHIQAIPSEVDFLSKLFSEQGKLLAIATIGYVLLKVIFILIENLLL